MLAIQVNVCYILKHLEDRKVLSVHIYYTWCDIILIFKLHKRTRLMPRSSMHSLKLLSVNLKTEMTSDPSSYHKESSPYTAYSSYSLFKLEESEVISVLKNLIEYSFVFFECLSDRYTGKGNITKTDVKF